MCSFTAKWNHSRGSSLSLVLPFHLWKSVKVKTQLFRRYSTSRGSRIKNSNEQLFLLYLLRDRSTEHARFASKLTLCRVIPVCESSYRCHYVCGQQMFFISRKTVWPCIFLFSFFFFDNLHRLRLQQALISPIARWFSCFNSSWSDRH